MPIIDPWRLDSSYHVRINVSVRRDIIWGISIHSMHKGGVYFFSNVYIYESYLILWSKGRCTKGGPKV